MSKMTLPSWQFGQDQFAWPRRSWLVENFVSFRYCTSTSDQWHLRRIPPGWTARSALRNKQFDWRSNCSLTSLLLFDVALDAILFTSDSENLHDFQSSGKHAD